MRLNLYPRLLYAQLVKFAKEMLIVIVIASFNVSEHVLSLLAGGYVVHLYTCAHALWSVFSLGLRSECPTQWLDQSACCH